MRDVDDYYDEEVVTKERHYDPPPTTSTRQRRPNTQYSDYVSLETHYEPEMSVPHSTEVDIPDDDDDVVTDGYSFRSQTGVSLNDRQLYNTSERSDQPQGNLLLQQLQSSNAAVRGDPSPYSVAAISFLPDVQLEIAEIMNRTSLSQKERVAAVETLLRNRVTEMQDQQPVTIALHSQM